MAKNKTSIILIADFGGSGSKFFYKLKEEWHSLLMPPEVTIMNGKRKGPSLDLEQVSPESNCQFSLLDTTYIVGNLAKQYQGHAGLKQNKFMRGILKVLGALQVIAAKHQLFPKKGLKTIELGLIFFLPYVEAENFPLFVKALRAFGDPEQGISTPYGDFRVQISRKACLYEGQGVYHGLPINDNTNRKVALMNVGYRNLSILVYHNGAVISGFTNNLGMVRMVEQVAKAQGITDLNGLKEAIIQIGNDPTNEQPLQKLLAREADFQKDQRIKQLREKIKEECQTYIENLLSWFAETDEIHVDLLYFHGGTAQYLGHELKTAFTQKFPWLNAEHCSVSIPEAFVPDGDPYGRFLDVYGQYLYLQNQRFDLTEKAVVKSAN
jgi:hypothetical protein